MTDDRLRDLYRIAQEGRASGAGGCTVPLEVMVDVVDGRLSDAEHRAALATIMADPRCRHEFELLRAASGGVAAPGSSRRKTASPTTAWPMRAWPSTAWAMTAWPMRVAAGIAVALGAGALWYAQSRAGDDPTRAPGLPAVELVAPAEGDHGVADLEFVWRSVPGAFRYELTLATAGGRELFSATLADTALVLPDSIRPATGEELRWWVEATTEDGAQLRAPLRRLRVIGP